MTDNQLFMPGCSLLFMVVKAYLNTILERFLSYAGHGVGDGDARQTATVFERIIRDSGHGVGLSIVRHRFGNNDVTVVSARILTVISTTVRNRHLGISITSNRVIDGLAIIIRHLKVVCGCLRANHTHKYDKQNFHSLSFHKRKIVYSSDMFLIGTYFSVIRLLLTMFFIQLVLTLFCEYSLD